MKKSILLSVTFLIISFVSIAQTEFGIKGGLNFTFFKVAEADFGTNPEKHYGAFRSRFLQSPTPG